MIRAIWSLLREVPTTIRLSIDANAAWHSLRPGCRTHWYDMRTMPTNLRLALSGRHAAVAYQTGVRCALRNRA